MFSLLSSREQLAAPARTATETRHYSSSTASLIACIVPMLFLFWACTLLWIYRYGQLHPRPLSKISSLRIQRFTPVCFFLVVLSSVIAASISCWLVLQFGFNNYYSSTAKSGLLLSLFTSIWTSILGGLFTTLLLHPTWSTHTICSVGFQAIWATITTILWLASIVTLAAGLRALFGVETIELVVLVFGAGFFIRLGFQVVGEQRITPIPVEKA